MKYRNLGKSGLKVSLISLGSWATFNEQISEETAFDCLKTAYNNGVNFFDTAEGYGDGKSETIIGRSIKKAGWKRSDLVLATKIFWGGSGPNDKGLSRKHIIEGTDASLKRLQTDYVDLIYCHRPDLETPIEETVWAMNHIINQGKALYWGTSEWSAIQVLEACHIARREHLFLPTMEQPEYHMFHRQKVEKDFLPLYEEFGLGTTIYSPLWAGFLTGKYIDGIPENSRVTLKNHQWRKDVFFSEDGMKKMDKVKKLSKIAKELNVSMGNLALAWVIKNPHVSSAITGASKPEQLIENLQALDVMEKITNEILSEIEEILDNKPAADQDWKE